MPAEVRGARGALLAVNRLRNQEILTPAGQTGRVTSVLIGDDGKYYAVVDFGPELGAHQVPITSVAYERNRFVVRESDICRLPAYEEGRKGLRMAEPSAGLDIAGYRATEDSSILVQGGSPQVTVQRPALEIDWEQAPPEVTVHQPTAHVNVRQLQPVIIVRQPPPRITVEMDQPEIIVRMPDPDVDVALAEPEVRVSVPRPNVRVVQPEQPQVRISSGEPLVSLAPREAADIAIEREQPQVRFERIGEPQVAFRQTDGAPRVRFEDMTRTEALTATSRTMEALELQGRKVVSSDGEEVGSVHQVLIGPNEGAFVVLERGGILGFAAQRILIPASSFALRGDRLYLRDMTAAAIRKLEPWDERMDVYVAASPRRTLRFGLLR
jgi:sporulation protein YlmC with PRC-barrel domain